MYLALIKVLNLPAIYLNRRKNYVQPLLDVMIDAGKMVGA